MKDFARAFYNSAAWAACRESYIAERRETDGGLCEVCRERRGEIVHHVIMLTPDNIGDPLVALNHDILRLDCLQCHNDEPGHYNDSRYKRKSACGFDENGEPFKR